MNYEFILFNHVGVVAKRVCAAAETAAHEGDDNTPSDPMGRGIKNGFIFLRSFFGVNISEFVFQIIKKLTRI